MKNEGLRVKREKRIFDCYETVPPIQRFTLHSSLLTLHCALLILNCILAAGCGYSFGTKISDDLRSIRIDIVKRWQLNARGLEFELTRDLCEALQTRTHLRPVRSGADVILDVTINRYKVGTVSTDIIDKVVDSNLLVEVRVKVTAKGKVIFDGELEEHEPFSAVGGETEEDARASASRKLARKILNCLAEW